MEDEFLIYGGGYLGLLLCDYCLNKGIFPKGIIDRSPDKQGIRWRNMVSIMSPDYLNTLDRGTKIIVAHSNHGNIYDEIRLFLNDKGFKNVEHIYEFAQRDEVADLFDEQKLVLRIHSEKVRENSVKISAVGKIWDDEISRKVYTQIISALERGMVDGIDILPLREQYFLNVFSKIDNEVFVDIGGGPTGDVLQEFLERNRQYCRYYYFEPDENIYTVKTKFEKNEQIIFNKLAVSDTEEKLFLKNFMDMNSVIDKQGEQEVISISLDAYQFKESPTFIKIDAEGYERRILQGAEQTILSCRPIIACATYHSEEDFWEIPLYLYNKLKDYRYYIRSYLNISEVILYAIPKERWVGYEI
ncbi:MAG: FkbM family methyltransferase [Lachnospiraceae bacterium]|nr:FkbM family methyltransferase [Lachnospiraceae bacterium]